MNAFDQLLWERDTALEQLKALGAELGEDTEITKKRIIKEETECISLSTTY